jgi:hypothetical protein
MKNSKVKKIVVTIVGVLSLVLVGLNFMSGDTDVKTTIDDVKEIIAETDSTINAIDSLDSIQALEEDTVTE